MKKLFILLAIFFASPAFAVPKPGVTYTYYLTNDPQSILREPDGVLIPLKPTGAYYPVTTVNAQGVSTTTQTFVADPPNEDLAAYNTWAEDNTATLWVPPPTPAAQQATTITALQSQVTTLQAQVNTLQAETTPTTGSK